MNTKIYLQSLTKKVFKILPLKEQNNEYLDIYIDSLLVELIGAFGTYALLEKEPDYITVVNTLEYLNTHECELPIYRREILKCTTLIDKLSKRM